MLLGERVYTLPIESLSGTKPELIASAVEAMSCNAYQGRIAIIRNGELLWFNLASGEVSLIANCAGRIDMINIDDQGVVYVKLLGKGMYAWKDGRPVEGYPKQMGGERPQLVGDHWYAHASHGTIKRYNREFEPDPGVVLGGASGSFIGFLPQSADLTLGRGMVEIQADQFAVSGNNGTIQLMRWDQSQRKFRLDRRIGGISDLQGLALNHEGSIWTNLGVWDWHDGPAAPRSLGEPATQRHLQPVVTEQGTLCVLRERHSRRYISSGPFVDENGWSRYHADTVKGLKNFGKLRGSVLVPSTKNQRTLFIVDADGIGYEMPVSPQGRLAGKPQEIKLENLRLCTSLAFAQGVLYAVSEGQVVEFARTKEGAWQERARWDRCAASSAAPFGESISIHSDGDCLAISDTLRHRVLLVDPQSRQRIAQFGQLDRPGSSLQLLNSPTHIAVSGDRLITFDAANQRIVQLELSPPQAHSSEAVLASVQPPTHSLFADEEYVELRNLGGLNASVAMKRDEAFFWFSLRTDRTPLPTIELGLAATKAIVLNSQSALVTDRGFDFQVPVSLLDDRDSDWNAFRWGASLSWEEGSAQRERISHVDQRAVFRPLSRRPEDWAAYSLSEYERQVTERKNEIWVEFQQPFDGKATIVIEDQDGKRVRNLMSGQLASAGTQRVRWDGLDENGKLVSPGQYRWRGISHPGLKPKHLMNFANGGELKVHPWGPNHSVLHDVTSNGEL
ncbi:MAG: FlgD immunoglobulin-like domain containing protein, partial [Blastopirellula sp. JB062]